MSEVETVATPEVEVVVESTTPEVATPEVVVETPRRTHVTAEQFVKCWVEVCREKEAGTIVGSGVDEVADRLGLKKLSVSQRATQLRAKGVDLPLMPKKGARGGMDLSALNELCKAPVAVADTNEADPTNGAPADSDTPSDGVNEE